MAVSQGKKRLERGKVESMRFGRAVTNFCIRDGWDLSSGESRYLPNLWNWNF